jgi:hypothetical protein
LFINGPLIVSCLVLGLGTFSYGEEFFFDSPEKWQSWQIPKGIVEIDDEGRLELKRFRKEVNAVVDAHLFKQPTQERGEVTGGIWQAGSNSAQAPRIMDGDLETVWSFDDDDELVDWVVTIDLGRPVLAERIRLHFPDREGARPWSQFSVFTATGARIKAAEDVFKFNQIYRTTQPNTDQLIDIGMVGKADTVRVIDEGLEFDEEKLKNFRVVRFVRIRANEKSADAALAEVEVIAAGENVSLGVIERGGGFDNGLLAREPQNMFDGIMDTYGNIFTVQSKGGWRQSGVWWSVDLGAQFLIDEAFVYWQTRGEGLSSFLFGNLQAGAGYELLTSDGRRTITGDLDYTPLIFEPAPSNANESALRHFRYRFATRKVRYLFWHSLTDQGWFSHPMELMLFSPGYPAQVTLESDFIDLGQLVGDERPKTIKSINWEAETPPNTRLQLRTRSGNQLQEFYTYYDRKGDEVTETGWASAPKVLRGPIDTSIVSGNDWGEWSNFYQFSGETFKSETPRRYVQLELIISTEDFEVAPVVNSLSIDFGDALIQVARGRITPREAVANEATQFTYTIFPEADELDSGFDRLRISTPSAVDVNGVDLQIGGVEVTPISVVAEADSILILDLPEMIRGDSIQVSFVARVLRNATLFAVDLGQAAQPGIWQSVEALGRRTNIVFLPDLVGSQSLIGDLTITPNAFTPNGDGINDETEIHFVLFKAIDVSPEVVITDLEGRVIVELTNGQRSDIKSFTWNGRTSSGDLVAPGIYLCHIDPGSDAETGRVVRSVVVAY